MNLAGSVLVLGTESGRKERAVAFGLKLDKWRDALRVNQDGTERREANLPAGPLPGG